MTGTGSGRNHPANQAPNIGCTSISHLLGLVLRASWQGESGGESQGLYKLHILYGLYRFLYSTRFDVRIDRPKVKNLRISRPETTLFGLKNP
jgi:hypothetical protein